MGVCLRVLREINKSRFDSYSVRNNRNSVLTVSHITFWYFGEHIFRTICIKIAACIQGDIKVKPKTAQEMREPVM